MITQKRNYVKVIYNIKNDAIREKCMDAKIFKIVQGGTNYGSKK